MTQRKQSLFRHQAGLTLVELMVALAIGSFLIIGPVQIYTQSRQAFVVNESIARVQETAQFAMDTIEADLRMASNWGRNSRGLAVEGRSIVGDANPTGLTIPTPSCGDAWAFDLAKAIDGIDNGYSLPCAANGGAVGNSDVITVRRTTVQPTPLEAGRLQIQSTRVQGQLFEDGNVPAGFSAADSSTHNLIVNSYYVAPNCGKEAIALNLKSEQGRAVLHRLITDGRDVADFGGRLLAGGPILKALAQGKTP